MVTIVLGTPCCQIPLLQMKNQPRKNRQRFRHFSVAQMCRPSPRSANACVCLFGRRDAMVVDERKHQSMPITADVHECVPRLGFFRQADHLGYFVVIESTFCINRHVGNVGFEFRSNKRVNGSLEGTPYQLPLFAPVNDVQDTSRRVNRSSASFVFFFSASIHDHQPPFVAVSTNRRSRLAKETPVPRRCRKEADHPETNKPWRWWESTAMVSSWCFVCVLVLLCFV